ncbi:unnamed protein product [Orchesella dallaii]|uniref:ERAP1-like C-terminal domain-containing protein n=1 Tax=Orchesella dallaii TaxID=48710 RepID=A0ABP1S8C8_9HEXA
MEDGINLIPTSDSEPTNAYMVQHITQGLAKQWVGQWWDPEGELILSDIYPRYISYLGLEAISPSLSDLAVYTDFLEIETLGRLTAKSELEASNKGALLIRSFEGVLTRDGVRRAVKLFLKHLWGVADETDYFDLSEMVAGNYTWGDMVNVLVGFMNNDGIPVVKASIANGTHFAFRQEPFRKPDKEVQKEDDESSLWLIPLSFTENHQNSRPQITWLTPHENVTFAAGSTGECILVNPDATGYHRTLYDDPNIFNRIQNFLEQNHEAIQPLTRARLLADYFAFAEQDYCPYSTALNLTTYMSRETNLVVWTAFLDKFTKVYARFLSHPEYPKLQHYLLPKVDLLLTETEELSAESIDLELFRAKLLLVGCRFQIQHVGEINPPYCQTWSSNLFHSWRNSADGASPLNYIFPQTLRPILECSIVATGGKEAFDFLFKKYQELKANSESYYGILSSLACVQETSVIEHLLQKTLQPISTGGFGSKDGWYVINFMIDTPMPNGRAQILPFISSNFDQVVEKIGDGYSSIIPQLLRYLADYLSTTKQKQEIEDFVSMHQDKIMNTTDTSSHLNEAFAAMDSNIQWMNAYSQDILNWLDKYNI